MSDRQYIEDARAKVADLPARLRKLQAQLQADLTAALGFTSEDYTEEGLAKVRAERAEKVRAKHREELSVLQASLATNGRMVEEYAAKHRPTLGTDAASLQRAQMKWDQVRARLEAGMTLRQVIDAADAETLLAIAEWGPSYLEAQAHAGQASGVTGSSPTADVDGLRRSIDARLVAVGNSEEQWALQAQQEVAKTLAGIGPIAQHVQGLLDGQPTSGGALEAAVESHYAMAETGRGLDAGQGDTEGGEAA